MSKRNIILLSSFLALVFLVALFYFFHTKKSMVPAIINLTPEQDMTNKLINYKPNSNDPVTPEQINKELNSVPAPAPVKGKSVSDAEMLKSLNEVTP